MTKDMRHALLLLAGLSVATLAPNAFADEAPKEVSAADEARADALFEEGRKLATEGRYTEACPKFEESHKVRPGIGALFNLADCNEKIGKSDVAYSQYKEVVERTKAALQPERQKVAQERLEAIEAKLSKLTIVVPSSTMKVSVYVDDKLVPPDKYNKGLIIPAGEHQVRAETERDEGEPFETTVVTEGGGKNTTVAIPIAAGAKMKRRTGMIIAGSIVGGIGALATIGSVAMFVTGIDSTDGLAPAVGLGALGVVGLAVGIPLFAVGMKKRPVYEGRENQFVSPKLAGPLAPFGPQEDSVPVASPIPEVVIGATGGSVTWHF